MRSRPSFQPPALPRKIESFACFDLGYPRLRRRRKAGIGPLLPNGPLQSRRHSRRPRCPPFHTLQKPGTINLCACYLYRSCLVVDVGPRFSGIFKNALVLISSIFVATPQPFLSPHTPPFREPTMPFPFPGWSVLVCWSNWRNSQPRIQVDPGLWINDASLPDVNKIGDSRFCVFHAQDCVSLHRTPLHPSPPPIIIFVLFDAACILLHCCYKARAGVEEGIATLLAIGEEIYILCLVVQQFFGGTRRLAVGRGGKTPAGHILHRPQLQVGEGSILSASLDLFFPPFVHIKPHNHSLTLPLFGPSILRTIT